MIKTDEYGKWKIEEANGCINRILIEPSQKYLDENPIIEIAKKSIEEQIAEMAEQLVNAQEALDFLIMGGM